MAKDENIDVIAQSLAAGMSAPEVRADILATMRASPWGGHRVILTEYLRSPEGDLLAGLSARSAGVGKNEFTSQVEQLGDLEFLVPLRAHRLTWRGTSDIAVSATLEPEPKALRVFGPDGASRVLSDTEEFLEYGAVFVLRPVETFGMRIGPQANVPGSVIQDPDDGELATVLTVHQETGPVVVDYGVFDSEERRRAAVASALGQVRMVPQEGSPQRDVSRPDTYLEQFATCFGDASGDDHCEVEFLARPARLWDPAGGPLYTLRYEGVTRGAGSQYPRHILVYGSPPGSDLIAIDVRETDAGGWDDEGTSDLFDKTRASCGRSTNNIRMTQARLGW